MKIIYAKIDNLLKVYGTDFLQSFAQKKFGSSKKLIEHSVGRYLTDFALKNLYKIDKYFIDTTDKKPKLDINLDFSISHTENLVFAAFSRQNVGLDVEFMKDRNFKEILKHYDIEKDIDKVTFYQLWTVYEALIKHNCSDIKSFKFENYVLSISSHDKDIEIYEVINNNTDVKSVKRYDNKRNKKKSVFEELVSLDFGLKGF